MPEKDKLFRVGDDLSIFKIHNGLSVFLRFEGIWLDPANEKNIWKKIEKGQWTYVDEKELEVSAYKEKWSHNLERCLAKE